MARKKKIAGPDFIRFFQPILDALNEKDASATPREVFDWIIENLDVSDEELEKTNKNGRSNFENKVAFARFYLTKAGYLDGGTRGVWALSNKGRNAKLTQLDAVEIFKMIQSETRLQKLPQETSQSAISDAEIEETSAPPVSADFKNRFEVEQTIAETLSAMSPEGFEEFVARLLRTLGLEKVRTQGGAGDGGIDGVGEMIIDRFLRIRVAFQCKKYQEASAITPEKVRDFRGAISGRVDRGIFITTSRFTRAATEEAQRENVVPIELIDLSTLISIIIDERVGVKEVAALEVESSFFEQYLPRSAEGSGTDKYAT